MILWGATTNGPTALPGLYQVRLTVDGQSQTQPLTIRKHPLRNTPDGDLQEQFALGLQIRDKVSVLPGTNVNVGQPISHRIDHMLSGTLANVAVKIFGDDLRQLRLLARQVQASMAEVPGVVDLSLEQQTDIPTLRIRADRDRAEALSSALVSSQRDSAANPRASAAWVTDCSVAK